MQLNNRTSIQIVEVYAPTQAYKNGDVTITLKEQKTQHKLIMSDFNAKLDEKWKLKNT